MDSELKSRWLTALRSGDYRQTKGKLRSFRNDYFDDGYCCLGVLCDISGKGEWNGDYYKMMIEDGYSHSSEIKLPGLDEFEMTPDQQSDLINMNDDGKSFLEIADWIEENL